MDFVDGILIGSGKQSKNLCQIITLPSSPPHNVQCLQNSENQLTFKWDEPIKIAPDVEVDNYNFKLMKEDSHHEPIIEPTTTEPTTTKPTTIKHSTKPSKQPEYSTSITKVPNSSPNPMPISETFSTKRQKMFSKFLHFIDFLSFSATNKEENALRAIAKEVTIPRNVDGKLTDDC